jgi:hypothetical protein
MADSSTKTPIPEVQLPRMIDPRGAEQINPDGSGIDTKTGKPYVLRMVATTMIRDTAEDGTSTQMREAESEAVTAEYTERVREAWSEAEREALQLAEKGQQANPIVLMRNPFAEPLRVWSDGSTFFLSDGAHRLKAFKRADVPVAPCKVFQGSFRDALFDATGANVGHGLNRTPTTKRNAVLQLLKDPHWGSMSDRQIAKQTGSSHPTVAKLRAELYAEQSAPSQPLSEPAPTQPQYNGSGVVPDEFENLPSPYHPDDFPSHDDRQPETLTQPSLPGPEEFASCAVEEPPGFPVCCPHCRNEFFV